MGIAAACVALSAAALSAAGCNLITGADRVEIVAGSGGAGASVTSGSTDGSGPSSDAAGTDAASSASTATAAQTSANSQAASSSSSAMACMYPPGPYGVAQGKIVPPTLKWQGYPEGGMAQGTLSIQDLYDCDGSKGINAIMFDTSQFG